MQEVIHLCQRKPTQKPRQGHSEYDPDRQDYPDESVAVICHVVKKLPTTIPPETAATLLEPQQQQGRTPVADPTLGGDIDVLLGVSDSSHCHRIPRHYTEDMAGYAAPTIFGWVLGGRLPGAPTNQTVLFVQPVRKTSDDSLQLLWEMDQVPNDNQTFTKAETRAVEHYKNTHQSLPDGHFMVKLPRKECPPDLGHSRPTALKRFLRNEKSLKAKGQLTQFVDVMEEYFALDHAEVIPLDELDKPSNETYYFPIHSVIKEASTTTKLRAVFDASCKTTYGQSLNDQLLPGPKLYPLLSTVLNRFRMHQISLTADISKMFWEILLHPEERDFHRFLHRDKAGQLVDARMKRVTFCVTSSPFLAPQTLHQLAELGDKQYPVVS